MLASLQRSLARIQPCFRVKQSNIRVLNTPQNFYNHLLDMFSRAKNRIFISSLYIGAAETVLIDTLHASLHAKPSLHLHLHLDLNRSTRPGPSSTVHLLLPLLNAFPNRVHVHLFLSPKLKGLMASLVPPRFNEGWGTWHAKIYGADDEVLISGANLNKSYFTNRQDRYIVFASEPVLADYCFAFLQASSTFSYRLKPTPIEAGKKGRYILEWPNSHVHPQQTEQKANSVLLELQASHLHRSIDGGLNDNEEDALIFPVIQAGQFNLREEERCLALLFEHLSNHWPGFESNRVRNVPVMDLTSGYFGLYEPYQDLIIRQPIDGLHCRIVAASPKANGFYGSSGISGRIPEGYTLLEQRFMRRVDAAGRQWTASSPSGGVQLDEWERDDWTYHAKGIWLSPTPTSPPVLTLFGSTNLNSRSAHLDTELSFLMLLPSSSATPSHLRHALAEEVRGLRAFARPWWGEKRRVRCGTRAIVGVVGGML